MASLTPNRAVFARYSSPVAGWKRTGNAKTSNLTGDGGGLVAGQFHGSMSRYISLVGPGLISQQPGGSSANVLSRHKRNGNIARYRKRKTTRLNLRQWD